MVVPLPYMNKIVSVAGQVTKNELTSPRLLSYQELDILHALRGFCAFYVVVHHAKFILWSGGTEYLKAFPRTAWSPLQYFAFATDMLSSAAYEMVIFFFVLSGFFIRYAQQKKYRKPLRFYLNRVVRIYPPYLASLVLSGAVVFYLANFHSDLLTTDNGREINSRLSGAWHEINPLALDMVGSLLLFLKPGKYYFGFNGAYWSLLPEALFYLLVPLAFWRIRYYYILSAACYAANIAFPVLSTHSGLIGEYLFMYNGYFALGAGLYDTVVKHSDWLATFRRVNGTLLFFMLFSLFVVLIGIGSFHGFRVISSIVAVILAVLCVSVLLAGRISRQNPLIRIFHSIGIFSFSLYLFHIPLLFICYSVLVVFTGETVNYTRYYWLAIPVVTAACFAIYCVTERLAVRFFRGT